MAIRNSKTGSYIVDVYDSAGRKIVKRFKKKSDAVAYEVKFKHEKRETLLKNYGLQIPKKSIIEAIEEYRLKKNGLRPRTIQKYNNILKQFGAFTAALDIHVLTQFNSEHASLLYNELTKERSIKESKRKITPKPKTVNGYLLVIRAFFAEQIIRGYINKNPMAHIKNMRVDKRKPEYYSSDELKLFFLQEMEPTERLAFQGLLYTGMRFEELATRTWNDIDFEKKTIQVTEKSDFKAKTENSYRKIPLTDNLYMLLKEGREHKKAESYIFTSPKGQRLRERRLLERCKSIAKKAGLQNNSTLHKFRHTFATHLVLNRVPLERVQKLLGHSSINETLIYAHLIPDYMHEDVSVLNTLTL